MLKKYWKNAISLVLVVALLIGILPTVAYAQDVLPTELECDTQTGMSTIYEYQPFDIGKAGTAYLNTYLSTLHVRRSDLSLGGNRLPVNIEFYYDAENILDADSAEVNPYGYGWTTAYSQIVHFDAEANRFAYKNENGTWVYFADSGTTTDTGKEIWTEQTTYGIGATGAVLHLTADALGTDYESVDIICNDVHHRFDSNGRLVSLEGDANQVSIAYVPGSQYKIQQITDAVGRQYCFLYSSANGDGVLTQIICKTASGETITSSNASVATMYGIENGLLLSVTQSNGDSIAYAYDPSGRLVAAANVDACGFAFAYSGETNTISTITTKAGMGTELEDSGNVVTVEKDAENETTVTDGDIQQSFTFDNCGRLSNCELRTKTQNLTRSASSQYTCVYGFNMTYGYVTDEDGIVTNSVVDVEVYDADGVIEDSTEETEPTETEPEETEASDYSDTTDAYGNILSETQTEGTLHQTTTYTYSSDGNYLASKTDENGNTEHYTYDANTGLLEALVDGNGNRTEYTYNAMRELTNVHLDMESIVGSTGMDADYTYAQGRLTQLDYGNYHYLFSYDIWGNVLSVTMNDSPLVSYDYGNGASRGMVETMTYGNGQEVFYTYNALGQVAAVGYTGQSNRFQYTYDTDGSLASIYDSQTGQTTEYNESGYEIRSANGAVLYSCTSGEDNHYTETVNGVTYQSTLQNQNNGSSSTKEIKDSSENRILSASTSYDAFNRLRSKSVNSAAVKVEQDYYYTTDERGNTGSLVEDYYAIYSTSEYQTSLSFNYTYDGNGNITGITKTERSGNIGNIPEPEPPVSSYALVPSDGTIGGSVEVQKDYHTTYAYDEAGQLIEAVDGETGKTYRYTYDEMGNILTAKTYTVSTSGSEKLVGERTYNYVDGILRGYTTKDGVQVPYQTDAMGNPTKIGSGLGGTTLTWGEGRMLTGISKNALNQVAYTYNADGLRTAKTVTKNGTTTTTQYIWGDNGLVAAITGNQTVVVLYGAEGEAVGFSVGGTVYTYVKNLQGDVIRILDEDGTAVVSYTYDPWGVPTVSGDTGLAAVNPCSYRGYYYDQETGFYYLQSRYYDPEIGRFLNADEVKYLNSSNSMVSCNLYSYCNNSPVFSNDPDGHVALAIAGATIYISAELVLAVCAFLLLVFVITYRKQIQQMISRLLSNLKALANALSVVVQNALKKSRLRRNVIHHIVAKADRRASTARYYLTNRSHGNMSVNSSINLISLNERFHRHLHTNAYFASVNSLLAIGNNKVGVIAAMCLIRTVLWAVNRRFF